MTTRLAALGLLCCTLTSPAAELFSTNATWRFLRGTNEASLPDTTAWRAPGFAAANFADASAPFWYGDVRPGGTQLTDMLNRYTCLFLRKNFTLSDAAQVGGLRLTYYIDDGFVLWINGTEVFRENVSGDLLSTNTVAANQAVDPAPMVSISIAPPPGVLQDGNNVVAIQVFNTSLPSTDLGFDLAMESVVTETIPPTVTSVVPPSGSLPQLTQVAVTFSEPVRGVDATDLLIAGLPAEQVTRSANGALYTFEFTQPPFGLVAIAWAADHGITDEAFPPNAFNGAGPGATWQYTLIDTVPPVVTGLFPSAGVTVRSLGQIEVSFSESVAGVDPSDLLINNQPATGVTHQAGGPYVFQFPSAAAGTVNVRWATGHGITDTAASPNSFAGGFWTYTVDPNATLGSLVINEVLASNQSGLKDEDSEPSDWIEIYNKGGTPVNLAGWSLSDDPEVPGLWSFPAVSIGPGGYLMVFASGKNRTSGPSLHTNFQLGGDGEFLGLYTADSPRVLVSGFGASYPEQRNDYSYGADNQGTLRYYSVPTPGAPNGTSAISGVAAGVHFSASRGFYSQPFDLQLSSATPGAVIRYTTDATEPTALNGRLYGGPLRLTNTTLIRAAAFRTGLLPSKIATHSYLFHLTPAQRTLPVISLVTAQSNWTGRAGIQGMFPETGRTEGTAFPNPPINAVTDYHNPSQHGIAWERPVSAEYILPDGSTGFQIDCGIRVQGSDWQRPRTIPNSKFSYRLYFRGEYGNGRLEYPMFPLTSVQSFDQVVLRAGYNEKADPFVRDEAVRRLSHDMGQAASHGDVVLLLRNGGIHTNDPADAANTSILPVYNPCERVHSEMLQSYYGGGSKWDIIAPSFAVSSEGTGVVDGDRVDFERLMTNFWAGSVIRPITNQAAYQRVAQRLDLANFVDYCLLNSYVAMGDWPANNWRAARERATNGIWRFVAWDAEWGMGIYSTLTTNRDSFAFSGTGTEDAGLNSTGNAEIARIYQALRPNREFRLLWADRLHKHMFVRGGALTSLNVSNRISELRTRMSALIKNAGNWQKLHEWPGGRPGVFIPQLNTYGLYGYSNALYGVFASSNAPALSQHGGRVPPGYALSLTAPQGGSIYYTTNGDDPRVPFTGAVSNSAVQYTAPINLTSSGPFKARTLLNGTNWSALADATFDVGVLGVPIRITEIMYQPAGGSPFEYIELQNFGGNPVDMSGFYFADGINFVFLNGTSLAPGARIVLANGTDPVGFAARYPGLVVAGYFTGNLNNAGEKIVLVNRAGDIVTAVDYHPDSGWPVLNGSGASLEVVDGLGDSDDPANWRANPTNSGTPGLPNAPVPSPAIEISEVLADNVTAVNNGGTNPDYVELFNPGGTAASLAGWSLTDDGNARKFVFPGGTQIPAQGRLVIWLDATTNTTPGLHAGFSLDRQGDSVFLFNSASGLVDAITLGLQLPNLSVGRIGGQWMLTTPTPNTANVAFPTADASQVRINEWLANPSTGQDDWIELYNPASQPVALRGTYLSNGASTHRITSLSFIAAGGFIQLLADENAGVDHVYFRLAALGGTISFSDANAAAVDSVSYTNSVENVSRGRLPDGSATFASFAGSASPAAPNFQNTYTGPILNEVLARNRSLASAGRVADYVELFNGGASAFDLGGMSLSFNSIQPREWIFPPGTSIAAGGYLVIPCDDTLLASTNSGAFNTGEALDGESGGVYLFNASGQMVDSVEYGFQIVDRSIGRISGQWRLLTAPTPGGVNSTAASLGVTSGLRVNEWMADPASGADWFEVYNSAAAPVELSGLVLTDDPSVGGLAQFRIAPLSFIGAGGFTKWVADGQPGDGRNHVNFSLDAAGESLLVLTTNGTNFILIDGVSFATQARGTSQGRLPDGSANIVSFIGSVTPGESNYRLAPVVINEILTHADAPLEDAVEIYNPGSESANIGGWYLSNAQDNFKKFRVPDGTVIPSGGYVVFSQSQFGNNGANSFSFDRAHDGEAWLSAADGAGNLTGVRAGATFGAAGVGVSFGRVATSVGVDHVAQVSRTLGSANSGPVIGPIVINEIQYNPISGEEFIEVANIGASSVSLFDLANPTNTWRLAGGVSFQLPANRTIAPGLSILIVDFNPADAGALAAFRARYGVPGSVPVYGPFTGRLDNDRDSVRLERPDAPLGAGTPEPGFVPYLVVDRADYTDSPPWPTDAVIFGGYSLQRRTPATYGNEPVSWVGALPTAGTANSAGTVPPPVITTSPQNASVVEGQSFAMTVSASGAQLTYQWRYNGIIVPDATNASYVLAYPVLENEGLYDVVVSNPGGSAVSSAARLSVRVPPEILTFPISVATQPGSNIVFSVFARGSAPLQYQWRLNGVDLPGRTSPTISLTNVQLADDGQYDVVVSNPVGTTTASARLDILIRPVVTLSPMSQSVVAGQTITLSAEATGNPLPFTFEWRRGSTPFRSNVVNRRFDFVTVLVTNTPSGTDRFRAVIKNLALTQPGAPSLEAIITILPDTDGDGLPDAWETQYGFNPASNADRNLDSDLDGLTNWQEYLAGTDPSNPASYLRVELSAAPNTATVSFNAAATKTYTVLYSDNLSTGVWSKLQDVLARATSHVETVVDSNWRAGRFYKLVTPAQ